MRSDDFDALLVCKGRSAVRSKMQDINSRIARKEATAKEVSSYATLQIVNEMLARGIGVLPVDIYKSDARKFLVEGDKIRLPFSSLSGVGEAAAIGLAQAREEGEFTSIEDFRQRAKVSKTIIEMLREINAFSGLPETSQLTFM